MPRASAHTGDHRRPRRSRCVPALMAAFILWSALAAAAQAVQRIELRSARDEILADGSDAAHIEVLVTVDRAGAPVPDGTLVQFLADIGTVDPEVATTVNGRVEARYTVLSQSASEVTIRASAGGKISEEPLRLRIVQEKRERDKGARFLEIRGDYLAYFDSSALLVGYGNCSFSYRSLTITADRLQLSVPEFVLKASDAEVSNGKTTLEAKEFYAEFARPTTRGVALLLEPEAKTLYFTDERFFEADWPAPSDKFRAWEPGESKTVIKADKAIIQPGYKMILSPARIYYDGTHVFTLSARELSLGGSLPDEPQYFGWGANGPIIDIPWYAVTQRKVTALVRGRYGSPFGPVSGREGFYVDTEVELHTDAGDDAKVAVDGLFTNTYGASAEYTRQLDSRSRVSAFAMWPQHRYLSGNLNYWRSGDSVDNIVNLRALGGGGLTPSYSLDSAWNFRPKDFVGDWQWQYSFDATLARDAFDPRTYLESGIRTRFQPERFYRIGDRVTISPRLSAGASVDTLRRTETMAGGSLDVTFQVNRSTSVGVSYSADYRLGGRWLNGFNHQVTGRLNSFGNERWWLSASATYNLRNQSLFGVAYGSWEFIPKWYLDAGLVWQQFGPAQFRDYTIGLGREIGGQQARIVYSTSEGRIYFELRRKGGFFNF